jgi:hypothetical protein
MLAAPAAGFSGAFAVLGKISLATLMAGAMLWGGGAMAAVAMLAALSAGFGRQLTILREAALIGWYVLAALAAGLGGARRIVLEVPAAGLAAFAGDFPLLLLVHRRKAAVRGMGLVPIGHNYHSTG